MATRGVLFAIGGILKAIIVAVGCVKGIFDSTKGYPGEGHMGPPILRHVRKIRKWRCNVCRRWVMGYRCQGCLHNPWVPPGPMSTERNQRLLRNLMLTIVTANVVAEPMRLTTSWPTTWGRPSETAHEDSACRLCPAAAFELAGAAGSQQVAGAELEKVWSNQNASSQVALAPGEPLAPAPGEPLAPGGAYTSGENQTLTGKGSPPSGAGNMMGKGKKRQWQFMTCADTDLRVELA